MRVNCEGCAGCCVDWRALSATPDDHERVGPDRPLDDVYNLVPLTRDEVRAFVDAGYGDALTPRVWAHDVDGETDAGSDETGDGREDDGGRSVRVDGFDVAAVAGRPAFFVGLRKPPKPVAPVGVDDAHWLPTCAFLDPESLQCRIHGDDLYPDECATYPGRNLLLDVETGCERVEAEFGAPGDRLVEDAVPDDADPLLGPQAVGGKVFAHPDPAALSGRVERIAAGEPTAADRAEFVATAAGASPGTVRRNDDAYREYRERALDADSWVGQAIDDWTDRADRDPPDPGLGEAVEDDRGAPGTPGWD
ncbi:YkgJ family cysteine cluster protein [Halorubellus sp. JP-L1]|uniref:YkgJ family cysteine cluster protein n=1 Tax=Halorubellus sp. JP-L1 TaxID=2715753 RepID=UPI00140C25CE|nr:YkgJ family cysteine cluster protein [Halorubellus sp. JP-L1]NHN43379.1 YkgJ family cysteine cluster protein [Halorubellus sp. JP-L1]